MALLRGEQPDEQVETYARGQPLVSGETVTPGRYVCAECGYEHTVPEGVVQNLPVCPLDQNEEWRLA